MALTPIRVAFYNLGVQDSRLEGKNRAKWLAILENDAGRLWTMHDLDGLWLCEVGDHHFGLHDIDAVIDAITKGIISHCRNSGATEPTLVINTLAAYVQVCDTRRLQVLQEPRLMMVDTKRHCMVVVLMSTADRMKRSVLLIIAHAPDSTSFGKLTDSSRALFLSLAHTIASQETEGRFILGGDINSEHDFIMDNLNRLQTGSIHNSMLLKSKLVPRARGDVAVLSRLVGIQSDSKVGRTFSGAEAASDAHDAVVAHFMFAQHEVTSEQSLKLYNSVSVNFSPHFRP